MMARTQTWRNKTEAQLLKWGTRLDLKYNVVGMILVSQTWEQPQSKFRTELFLPDSY